MFIGRFRQTPGLRKYYSKEIKLFSEAMWKLRTLLTQHGKYTKYINEDQKFPSDYILSNRKNGFQTGLQTRAA